METTTYIHGTHASEQERLAGLNRLTNPAFLDFLDLAPSAAVLEVGSGLGLLASEVAARVPEGEVYGVEYSPEQLALAKDGPNLHFRQGDAHRLPFPDDTFDAVYCRYVLEHVRDPLVVLHEMRRVLRPGGRAFAQENNMFMVVFDPDCPTIDSLMPRFVALQARLGGDATIGKRLFGLFTGAGFRQVELSFQPEIHPATAPTFRPWIENAAGVISGSAPLMIANGLATEDEMNRAVSELDSLLTRRDACALFHWNRATGTK